MTFVFQAVEGFLTKLRLLKIESCCVEGFRPLKQPESIKRVVRREWADVTSTKVPQKELWTRSPGYLAPAIMCRITEKS